MTDDRTLLRRYAEESANDAFAEFVQRHLPLVYGAALRRLAGDAHAAEDICQTVFSRAARDARTLANREVITAWLYTATRNAAIDLIRAETRRRRREIAAQPMFENSPSNASADWSRLSPVLDAALDELREADRAAVLLRFFQDWSFADIGAALSVTEEAARKRVERALDQLQLRLQRKGIHSTGAALAAVLANGSLAATPPGLAASVAAAAVASTAAKAGLATLIAGSKLQAATVAGVLACSVAGVVWQQHTLSAARREALLTRQDSGRARAASAAIVPVPPELVPPARDANATPMSRDGATASATAPAPSATSPGRNVPAQAASTTVTIPGPLPNTPQMEQRKAAWRHRYEAFFRARGLTTAESERFVELKIHQELARADFQAAVRAANLRGDSPEVQKLRSRDDAGVTQGLRDLLGPEGYAAYGQYEILSGDRVGYLEPLAAAMTAAAVPLSTTQGDRLLALIASHARTYQARPTDIGRTRVIDWDEVIAQAGEFLSAEQVAVLAGKTRPNSTVPAR